VADEPREVRCIRWRQQGASRAAGYYPSSTTDGSRRCVTITTVTPSWAWLLRVVGAIVALIVIGNVIVGLSVSKSGILDRNVRPAHIVKHPSRHGAAPANERHRCGLRGERPCRRDTGATSSRSTPHTQSTASPSRPTASHAAG